MKAMHGALEVFDTTSLVEVRSGCIALGDFFIAAFDEHLSHGGFSLGSTRDAAHRGGHIALLHPDAETMSKALIARGFIVDFRPPNVIRIAFSPLFLRFADVAGLVDALSVIANSTGD